MKTRFKFTKEGYVKFVGHLDTVRLFQRAIKVAQIPIAYSQGFNPHALVYFAMPLAVGVSSEAEYMDIVTSVDQNPEEMMIKLNGVLPEGITLTKAFTLPDQGPSLMSLVQVADYEINLPQAITQTAVEACQEALTKEELLVTKKTKKGMKEVNIKPLLRRITFEKSDEGYTVHLQVAAGSTENLNPELLLKALSNGESDTWDYAIRRKELYTEVNHQITAIDCYEGA